MDTYGLIGYPLGHSFSRNFFTDKFASEGIDAEYKNFEIPSIDDLPLVITGNPHLKARSYSQTARNIPSGSKTVRLRVMRIRTACTQQWRQQSKINLTASDKSYGLQF